MSEIWLVLRPLETIGLLVVKPSTGGTNMSIQQMKRGVSLVMVGKFNPVIFQPQWFSAHKLLRPQEADNASVEVIHPDVTIFTAEWLQMRVESARFQVNTFQPPFFPALRDMVLGTFSILEHTPIWMLGINCEYHFRFDSEQEWNAFGDAMAPKERWSGLLETPGLLSLEIQGTRSEGHKGYTRVKVGPSPEYQYGVVISVNDHYQLPGLPDKPIGCSEITKILAERFETSQEMSAILAKRLLEPEEA